MKMANSCQVALSDFLGEQDPLPPEDRPLPRKRISLDALYRDHAPRLLLFFIRRAGRDDATDLVQETFARLVGIGEHGRDEIDRPEAYLGTVATNLLRDRARLAARRALERHDPLDESLVSSPDPHQLLEARDTLARLEQAVGKLSLRDRKIFLLHRLEHLNYAEIAEEVGMSVKGVKKQMAKALSDRKSTRLNSSH